MKWYFDQTVKAVLLSTSARYLELTAENQLPYIVLEIRLYLAISDTDALLYTDIAVWLIHGQFSIGHMNISPSV